eukprot:jgi/Bigna1/134186/aug1.24_g8894
MTSLEDSGLLQELGVPEVSNMSRKLTHKTRGDAGATATRPIDMPSLLDQAEDRDFALSKLSNEPPWQKITKLPPIKPLMWAQSDLIKVAECGRHAQMMLGVREHRHKKRYPGQPIDKEELWVAIPSILRDIIDKCQVKQRVLADSELLEMLVMSRDMTVPFLWKMMDPLWEQNVERAFDEYALNLTHISLQQAQRALSSNYLGTPIPTETYHYLLELHRNARGGGETLKGSRPLKGAAAEPSSSGIVASVKSSAAAAEDGQPDVASVMRSMRMRGDESDEEADDHNSGGIYHPREAVDKPSQIFGIYEDLRRSKKMKKNKKKKKKNWRKEPRLEGWNGGDGGGAESDGLMLDFYSFRELKETEQRLQEETRKKQAEYDEIKERFLPMCDWPKQRRMDHKRRSRKLEDFFVENGIGKTTLKTLNKKRNGAKRMRLVEDAVNAICRNFNRGHSRAEPQFRAAMMEEVKWFVEKGYIKHRKSVETKTSKFGRMVDAMKNEDGTDDDPPMRRHNLKRPQVSNYVFTDLPIQQNMKIPRICKDGKLKKFTTQNAKRGRSWFDLKQMKEELIEMDNDAEHGSQEKSIKKARRDAPGSTKKQSTLMSEFDSLIVNP